LASRYFREVPRKDRIDLPDSIHHVAALAVEKQRAFREDDDRFRLLVQLDRVASTYSWRCLAYCLMGTHFHLIVHTRDANLSAGMQHLCGTYAQWFNWKYERRGHLFARRFASTHIVRESHLLEAHRYVALNPVRAGLCAQPADWPWGSFRALCGLEPFPDFLDGAVLGLVADATQTPQDAFRRLVESAITDESSTARV
jgi:REP element-mobilizing transposase RayT